MYICAAVHTHIRIYIHVVRNFKDDLKKIEKCRILGDWMWKCIFNACTFVRVNL